MNLIMYCMEFVLVALSLYISSAEGSLLPPGNATTHLKFQGGGSTSSSRGGPSGRGMQPGGRIVGKNHPSLARQQQRKAGSHLAPAKASGFDSDSDADL